MDNKLTEKQIKGPWTLFWDIHSGGGTKEDPYGHIYIQAPTEEAKIIFNNRFGHNPERVSCTCCGDDYSISESINLLQSSGFHRQCAHEDKQYIEQQDPKNTWKKYQILEQYAGNTDVLFIFAEDIKDEERVGELTEQGYVWVE